MNNDDSLSIAVPITVSLLGIAFILHFMAEPYYFTGSPPTGFSTGTLGILIVVIGVLLSSKCKK
ncbi:hypothetical protein Mzhil_0089 [Methanosalsum zhilinae DSM 4017]|uniref:Uncharacterized protein n=1 Tax=Methanosalsum zhilinae (strain DSM 4017 / NBRC 107636 / OCM 62 / WeN5) TaxID=679901 RepID=F7XMV3_METZD|nr:hypothetical protein [Methanosalsum zhilinae]AEH59970.1 hypothetical protein Mzhil_0089 [Methanosalsum zhilinae DSM 4017]